MDFRAITSNGAVFCVTRIRRYTIIVATEQSEEAVFILCIAYLLTIDHVLYLLFIISRGSSIFGAIKTMYDTKQTNEETRIKNYYHRSYLEIVLSAIDREFELRYNINLHSSRVIYVHHRKSGKSCCVKSDSSR